MSSRSFISLTGSFSLNSDVYLFNIKCCFSSSENIIHLNKVIGSHSAVTIFLCQCRDCNNVSSVFPNLFHTNPIMELCSILQQIPHCGQWFFSGTWETKVSNKEKREQRKKDKSSSDGSASPGGGDTPVGTPSEQPKAAAAPAPANQKKKKGAPLKVSKTFSIPVACSTQKL